MFTYRTYLANNKTILKRYLLQKITMFTNRLIEDSNNLLPNIEYLHLKPTTSKMFQLNQNKQKTNRRRWKWKANQEIVFIDKMKCINQLNLVTKTFKKEREEY